MIENHDSWPAAAAALGGLARPWRLAAAFAAGCGFALAQPPWGLWPLMLIAGPALFWLWRGVAGWRAFWTGWAFGAGFFGLGMHWIVEPFLVDAATFGWMAPFALILLAGGLALFPGFGAMLAARLPAPTPLAAAAALTAGLSLGEFARSYFLTGFPWSLPAYAWVDTPVARVAALVGPYALTLLTFAVAFAPALAGRRGPAAALLLIAAAWGWGAQRVAGDAADGPLVRVVQPNIDQATKWDPELVRDHLNALLDLTAAPGAGDRPAVIVWPESAVTFPIDMAEAARHEIALAAGGADVALGSLRVDGGPEAAETRPLRWRNSLFLLDAEGALSAPFDKVHLVPFGEYLPFDALLRGIGIGALAARGPGIVPGEAPVILRPANAPPVAPLICYEMIFPRETMAASEGADWMILATNDAWFGKGAGPEQHLAQARMRAIETGLPIARAANTGISAIIDRHGRLVARVNHGERGFAEARLPDAAPATLYRQIGELFAALTLIGCGLLNFVRTKTGFGKF